MGLWRGDATRLVGVQNPTADHGTYGGPPRPITPENVSFNNFDPVTFPPTESLPPLPIWTGRLCFTLWITARRARVSKLADGFAP